MTKPNRIIGIDFVGIPDEQTLAVALKQLTKVSMNYGGPSLYREQRVEKGGNLTINWISTDVVEHVR